MTWMATITVASAWLGLTFLGMTDDPGWLDEHDELAQTSAGAPGRAGEGAILNRVVSPSTHMLPKAGATRVSSAVSHDPAARTGGRPGSRGATFLFAAAVTYALIGRRARGF